MEARIRTEAPKLDANSIAAMTAKGLQVDQARRSSRRRVPGRRHRLIKTMRGGMVPTDIFDMALAERDAFRKTRGR